MKGGYHMRRWGNAVTRHTGGFTIVETLIVLAVTMVIFLGIVTSVSGRQNRTEFNQSINDAQNVLQQTINEVATNYYPNNGKFSCTRSIGSPAMPIISAVSSAQGTNKSCVFLGKVMQFGVGSALDSYRTYTITGLRGSTTDDRLEATSYSEARPIAIATGNSARPNALTPDEYATGQLHGGLTIKAIRYYSSPALSVPVAAVGFMTSLGSYTNNTLNSGSQQTYLVPIAVDPPVGVGQDAKAAVDDITKQLRASDGADRLFKNPPTKVTLCFMSGGTDEYGVVSLGGVNGRQLTAELKIYQNLAEVTSGDCA